MRMIAAAMMTMAIVAGATGAARADTVPPVKGNDTGGIISTSLVGVADVDAIAIEHCARYDKVPVRLSAPRTYGSYLSFACKWVPAGAYDRPLRVRY